MYEQISVSSAQQFADAVAALEAANGGTILLEPLVEGYEINLASVGGPDHGITIRSADPDDPARITRISISDSENVTISDVLVDSRDVYETRRAHLKDLLVSSSKDITIENSTFISAADGFVDGSKIGYTVGESLGDVSFATGFTFRNNVVTNYAHALFLEESNDTTIAGNTFTKLQFDSIRMVGMKDTLIENNAFHDFFGSLYDLNHSDMIQVWSVNAIQLTENLTIRGNYFNSESGAAYQTIFVNYENFGARGEHYRNVRIEDNTIYNAHQHGITVNHTDGVYVANNTVLYNSQSVILRGDRTEGMKSPPSIWMSDNLNATVENNIVSGLKLVSPTDTYNNFIVDIGNVNSDAYVGHNFINAVSGGQTDLRDLRIIAGSAADLSGAGSTATRPISTAETVTAVLTSSVARTNSTVITLDAGLSLDEDGLLDTAGTTYRWSFPDGTVLDGPSVTFDFDKFGPQPVTLTITTADGRSDTIIRDVIVHDPMLLSLDFDNGIADQSSYGTWVGTKGAFEAEMLVEGTSGQGVHVGGAAKLVVSRGAEQLRFLDAFSLGTDLKLDQAGDTGTLIQQQGALSVLALSGGAIGVVLVTDDGVFRVQSPAGTLQDADWHRLDLSYDGAALKLYFDGAMVSETPASGTLKPAKSELTLGGVWNASIGATFDNLTIVKDVRGSDDINALKNALLRVLEP